MSSRVQYEFIVNQTGDKHRKIWVKQAVLMYLQILRAITQRLYYSQLGE